MFRMRQKSGFGAGGGVDVDDFELRPRRKFRNIFGSVTCHLRVLAISRAVCGAECEDYTSSSKTTSAWIS